MSVTSDCPQKGRIRYQVIDILNDGAFSGKSPARFARERKLPRRHGHDGCQSGLKTWVVMGPGLKTGGVVGPGLKARGVVGPDLKTGGRRS